MSLRQTITRWLRRQKEIRKEGMIDILDSTGVPTGVTAHIYEIHDRGHWHATVNVYVVNSKMKYCYKNDHLKFVYFRICGHYPPVGMYEAVRAL